MLNKHEKDEFYRLLVTLTFCIALYTIILKWLI